MLFVSHEPDIGGSTVSLISLILGLKKATHLDIEVLLPYNKAGKASQSLKNYGIKYKKMWYRRNYKSLSEPYFIKYHFYDFVNKIAVYKLNKYIKTKQFDIVCSNSTGVDVGARASLMAGATHIYYVREFMEEDHEIEYRNKHMMKNLFEASDYIIFISKAVEKKYKSIYKFKQTIQFHDDLIVKNYYVNNHAIFRKSRLNFIQIGFFSDGKGTLNSIKLMNDLINFGIKDIFLEFVGNGTDEYKLKMRNLINLYGLHEHILISSYTNDIKTKLEKSDILIMNSRSEALGRVTIEGMLAGCFVIGRNSAGTAEIIQNGVNGLLYNDDYEFVRKINYILNNLKECRAIAMNAQKWAVNEYNVGRAAQNFMSLLT